MSKDRGKIPIGWAADPYLGTIFPELWNFYARNTTQNDTFIDGVDGAGYIFLIPLDLMLKRTTCVLERF